VYEYKCRIDRVVDGDTVDIFIDLGFDIILCNQRIRLYGIDTPESRTRDKQEKIYGNAAKKFLTEMLDNEECFIRTRRDARGKYGRILGEFIVPDKFGNEINVNQFMIDNHLGVAYHGQSKDDIVEQHLKNRKLLDPAYLT